MLLILHIVITCIKLLNYHQCRGFLLFCFPQLVHMFEWSGSRDPLLRQPSNARVTEVIRNYIGFAFVWSKESSGPWGARVLSDGRYPPIISAYFLRSYKSLIKYFFRMPRASPIYFQESCAFPLGPHDMNGKLYKQAHHYMQARLFTDFPWCIWNSFRTWSH